VSNISRAGPFGVVVQLVRPFCGSVVPVLPAPVCPAVDTSPLDGFQALFCIPSWFASRPAPTTPQSLSACHRNSAERTDYFFTHSGKRLLRMRLNYLQPQRWSTQHCAFVIISFLIVSLSAFRSTLARMSASFVGFLITRMIVGSFYRDYDLHN
jgi:hypothetical protein